MKKLDEAGLSELIKATRVEGKLSPDFGARLHMRLVEETVKARLHAGYFWSGVLAGAAAATMLIVAAAGGYLFHGANMAGSVRSFCMAETSQNKPPQFAINIKPGRRLDNAVIEVRLPDGLRDSHGNRTVTYMRGLEAGGNLINVKLSGNASEELKKTKLLADIENEDEENGQEELQAM